MKPFIGIKKLWYGDPLQQKPTKLSTATSSMTEVKNVHEGTWGYSQDDPNVTDYINELTGQPYFRDMTSHGNKTINFTLGEYDFSTRKDLQGGKIENGMWEAPTELEVINKCIIAQTKTGNYICFPNAAIIAKVDTQEKNLGLGIVALAMETTLDSGTKIAEEYWEDAAYVAG